MKMLLLMNILLINYEEIFAFYSVGRASDDEERLFIDLFRGYNSLVRPVHSVNSSAVEVSMSMQLTLLINVVRNLKNVHAAYFAHQCGKKFKKMSMQLTLVINVVRDF